MKTRIISSLVMLPLLIIVWLGGWFLAAAGVVVSIIGIREFYNGFAAAGAKPSYRIGYSAVVLLYTFHVISQLGLTGMSNLLPLWAVIVVMASMIYGFNVNERKLEDMASTLFGIMYVVFLFYHVVLVDQSSHRILVWIIFLAAFGTDIMAYFSGMALGKHKLCPNLSPKKSKEGAVGGVIGAVVFCLIFGAIFLRDELLLCAGIGFFGSIVAQLGDLSASAFKRQMGIKDYGNLIPGHGGILDRFDSVLFVAPVVYYMIAVFAV